MTGLKHHVVVYLAPDIDRKEAKNLIDDKVFELGNDAYFVSSVLPPPDGSDFCLQFERWDDQSQFRFINSILGKKGYRVERYSFVDK